MRRILLSLVALFSMVATMMAGEVTFDFSAQGYTNAKDFDGKSTDLGDGVSVAWSVGTGAATPKYYTSGTAMRLYPGNTATFTSQNKITSIVCTYSSTGNVGTIAADCGEYSVSGTTGTWKGSSNTVVLTNKATSGHARLQKVVITYVVEPIIRFTEMAAKGTLNGKEFSNNGMVLKVTDKNSKINIDSNSQYFGTSVNDTVKFDFRLKTGGKSSSSNMLTLTVPSDGTLTIYARSANSADATRDIVVTDAEGTKVIDKFLDDNTRIVIDEKNVFQPASGDVTAGTYTITYPVSSVNIYGIVLQPTVKTYTLSATDKNGKVVAGKFAASPLTVKLAEYADGITFKVNGEEAAYDKAKGLSIEANANSTANDTYKVEVFDKKGNSVATKTYTWIPTAASVSALKSYAENTEAILSLSDAKVSYVDSKNAYIEDASAAVLAYNLGLSFTAYKQAAVNIWGKKTTYKTGVVEFVACDSTATSTVKAGTAEVTPAAKTVAETKLDANQLKYVKVLGVQIVKEGTQYYAVCNNDSVILYDQFRNNSLSSLETTPCYADVTGIVSPYYEKIELFTTAVENVTTTVETYKADAKVTVVQGGVEKKESFDAQTILSYVVGDNRYVVLPAATVTTAKGVVYAMPETTISGIGLKDNGFLTLTGNPTFTFSKGDVEGTATVQAVSGIMTQGYIAVVVDATYTVGSESGNMEVWYVTDAPSINAIGDIYNSKDEFVDWDPSCSAAMFDYNAADDEFNTTVTVEDSYMGYGWFALSTGFGVDVNDWDPFNASRLAVSDNWGELNTKGTLVHSEDANFKLPAGKYDITVNLNDMTIVIVKSATAVNAVSSANAGMANGKYLKNGRVVIVKNGKQYNAAGVQMK